LNFKEATYITKENKEANWYYISRAGDQKVVTCICKSNQSSKFLIEAQFRVSANKIMLEFPAGLIKPGESIEQAGLRELKEETGYTGKILSVSPFLYKSPGLTDEVTSLLEVEVDDTAGSKPKMDGDEEIRSFWLSPKEFDQVIPSLDPKQYAVDTLVWLYFSTLKRF
jgi:ADP-ribose pyrophosphatase